MARKEVHANITDESTSALKRYQQVVVGSDSLWFTIKFELLTTFLGILPGAVGLVLRKKFYRKLFKRVGRGVIFGTNVVIRHPQKIEIDDGAVISDGCVLDAGGGQARDHDLLIGKGVILGQNTMLRCKGGSIHIGENVGFGANCAVYAGEGNTIDIGVNGLIAPYVYIGSGRYHFDRTDIPIVEQGPAPLGGCRIGDGVWLGLRATVIDGADIGRDAIVSAGSVVTETLPPFCIAAGSPSRVIRYREDTATDAPVFA